MKIDIKLNGNTRACSSMNEPLILPENELKCVFSSDIYTFYTLLLSVRNGEKIKQYKLTSNFEVDLTEFLCPGIIEMEISQIVKGEVVKTWSVPYLAIKQISHSFEITPEIAEIKKEIESTKLSIKELYALLKNQNLI